MSRSARLAEFGHLLETFVVGELRKQISWMDHPVTEGGLGTGRGWFSVAQISDHPAEILDGCGYLARPHAVQSGENEMARLRTMARVGDGVARPVVAIEYTQSVFVVGPRINRELVTARRGS